MKTFKDLYLAGIGTIYSPRVHKLVECDWIRAVRRKTKRKDLILYHHTRTGNFMLANWAIRPGAGKGPGLMVDLETMENHPDHYGGGNHSIMDRPDMDMVLIRCQPVENPIAEVNRAIWEQERAQEALEDDTEQQRKSAVGFLKSKGSRFEKTARQLEGGTLEYVGDKEGGEELAVLRDSLIDMGRNRAYFRVTDKVGGGGDQTPSK